MDEIRTNPKWDIHGKYVLMTGATSGIRLAAAKELAARGAKLGIVARYKAEAKLVAKQIKNGAATVDVFLADMSSQASIRNEDFNEMIG